MAALRPHSVRLVRLLAIGCLLLIVANLLIPRWTFSRQVQHWILQPTIDPDTAESLFNHPYATAQTWRNFWITDKIPHRRAVAVAIALPSFKKDFQNTLRLELLSDAAVDPDLEVRERFLSTLSSNDLPKFLPAVVAQFSEPDPDLRQLGIKTLRRAGSSAHAKLIAPLVLDPDPAVALAADAALRNWTGQDTGLRLHLARDNPPSDPAQPQPRPALSLTHRLQLAHAFWNSWIASNLPNPVPPATNPSPAPTRLRAAPDFELPTLDGSLVRLRDFRGKPVLIHFWTTWCPACLREFPELGALRQRLGNQCELLGINLDSLSSESATPSSTASQPPTAAHASLKNLKLAVGSTAARHKIKHPLLLDPEQSVSRLFDGHELPTYVVVDSDGNLRYRMVGGRSADAWEKLIRSITTASPSSR